MVQLLLDELPKERVALSKKMAQQRYLESFTSDDELDPHRLKLATSASRDAAKDAAINYDAEFAGLKRNPGLNPGRFRVLKLLSEKGISPAEHAAIVAYSNSDFLYMNPATANDPTRIAYAMTQEPEVSTKLEGVTAPAAPVSAKMTGHRGGEDKHYVPTDDDVRQKTVREEGALLTALAMQGLAKMDPFEGVTYRGETTTEGELPARAPLGVNARPNLSSTAKKWSVALQFANANVTEKKDIALFWAIDHPPGVSGGRDIAMMSAVESEGEVLNMVGSPFATTSVTELKHGHAATGPHADYVNAILKSAIMTRARKVYVVYAVAVPKETGA